MKKWYWCTTTMLCFASHDCSIRVYIAMTALLNYFDIYKIQIAEKWSCIAPALTFHNDCRSYHISGSYSLMYRGNSLTWHNC